MAKELYKKYYRRVAREGILKALFISLAVGSAVLALTEFISWIFGFKAGLWIGFLAFAAVTAALTPCIYLKKYRPTAKAIARRVDALGLEERMITMAELEADESYIALLQREDTEKALKSVDQSLIKIAISASLIVALCVCATFGLGFITTEALHVAGVIPSVIGIAESATSKENIGIDILFQRAQLRKRISIPSPTVCSKGRGRSSPTPRISRPKRPLKVPSP